MIKRMMLLLMVLLAGSAAFAADDAELQIRAVKPGADVKVEQVIKDGKLLVSVTDAAKKPVLGLGLADFAVTQSGRTARVRSVQPMSENKDVPRHIVLVMDNSYSMYERKAIKALLSGVSALMKTVRPIDDVQMVVFDNKKVVRVDGRDLHVQIFGSNNPEKLTAFAKKSYQVEGLTGGTVLFEAMLAGLDIIKKMPTTEPRFMVVFSDGEDLNSTMKKEDVALAAKGSDKFSVYAIDYMERPETDKFLTQFANENRGQIWKARSETNIVPIFQSVASQMQYYYVVEYLFVPSGSMAVTPAGLTIDETTVMGAVLPGRISTSTITLKPTVDTVYGIARWKAVVSNKKGTVAEKSGEGAPAADVQITLPADLKSLVTNGDLSVKMTLEDRKGQVLALSGTQVKVNRVQTRADMSIAPASLTIDEATAMGTVLPGRISASSITLKPTVESVYGIARWKAVVSSKAGVVAEKSGEGTPPEELQLPLPADLKALSAAGDLSVKMDIEDRTGQLLALSGTAIKIRTVQTRAGLTVAPAVVKVEEIKTIDASPMLGHIYFAPASSEIPAQYIRFSGPGETAGFDEQKFTGTMEKYYQDLNIVGRRLAAKPEATITLVGCNDNSGKERNNRKLSTQRATAVREYLQNIWSIAPDRMKITTRNLPAKPSAPATKEGQAENRRVEIVSTDGSILAPIQSTYFATRIDTPDLKLKPEVVAPNGIAGWSLTASNAAGKLAEQSGKAAPAKEIVIPLGSRDLKALGLGGDISVKMELQDSKGQNLVLTPAPVKVDFVQSSKRAAEKQDQRIQEKYALILFDFNKDTVEAQNQEIVNRIVERIKALPEATVTIVGHTDNIGSEKYNLKLSERRASSVYKLLAAAYGDVPGDRIRFSGVGPNSPLFDNKTPEARSFNRTVIITLEYLSKE